MISRYGLAGKEKNTKLSVTNKAFITKLEKHELKDRWR